MKPICLAVTLLLLVAGCSDLESPTEIKLDDIIRIEFTGPVTLRADGVSTTTVSATIPPEATTRSVKFVTTRGSFQGTDGKTEVTVLAGDQGEATATLIAGREVGIANVTATAGTSTAAIGLPHERAYADAISIETTSASPKKDGTRNATITATLTRLNGFVSNGTQVTFEAFDAATHRPVGRFFLISPTDANGRASATFSPDTADTTVGMTITIIASTQTDAGTTVSASLDVVVA
jgi:hypothetical protein